MTYLYSGLWQVNFESYFFPHEDVRVAGFLKEGLEYVELGPREGGPFPALFARVTGCQSGGKKRKRELHEYLR